MERVYEIFTVIDNRQWTIHTTNNYQLSIINYAPYKPLDNKTPKK